MRSYVKYVAGLVGVLASVALLLPLRDRINSTPIALVFLLIVLFTAAGYGSVPALITSVASVLCLNFFFLPPYGTLHIADAENWFALIVFLITSFIAGGLSGRVQRRAEEAERKQKEIEVLYGKLKDMFDMANEAELMKQSEQLKSALLDAVTHDLRTPLTSMKAAVTTLLTGNAGFSMDEEGRTELLEVINTEIDRLNHHLEGLIEIARIEAGAMEPRRTWTHVDEIVSISLTRAAGLLSNHRVTTKLMPDLPPVRVDEKGISEVLYLLLENAAKYAPAQSEIILEAKNSEGPGIKISVEDRGVGIPPELRERVFDKFFRAGATVAQSVARPAGLGMGLAIARALVEAHGGRIWIEDGPGGRGTRISFTIPLSAP